MAMGLETRSRKRSLPGRPVYEDESERIYHHGPESSTPLKAEYIGADQLPFFVFRLQLCGGPYIPITSRLSGTTGNVARDLLILTVELPGKSSDNSLATGSRMKLCIERTARRGRATRRVSIGFGIDGGKSNESGNSMFLLVACGVFIGVAATR